MSYTYANRRRADQSASQREPAQQSSIDALRSGAAQPTAEQMGHRVDLPDAMRSKMEDAFGADLSAVKLYESQSVADAGAKAMTQGANIAFAPGMLDFTSFGGQSLLGHEISHVVSQARGEVTGGGFLNDHALEARADREGAMAAAGQTVAMPTAALSTVTAASAAGPMQAKDKDEQKKKIVPSVPGPITLEGAEQYKEGRETYTEEGIEKKSSSVLGVNDGGNGAVLKLGVNPLLEEALAAYYNVGGRVFDAKRKGSWSFDAPMARSLTTDESTIVNDAIGQKKLASTGFNQHPSQEQELAGTAVFSKVRGQSRVDGDEEAIKKEKKQGRKPLIGDPSKREGANDYHRVLGYTSLLDLAIGNKDRTIGGSVAPNNWIEDRKTHQIHLIDNDYQWNGGLNNAEAGAKNRQSWLSSLIELTGQGGNADDSIKFMMEERKKSASKADNVFFTDDNNTGASEALSDLPTIRKNLIRQFVAQNHGKKMNAYQRELLERLQITHEYMTDPVMAHIYQQLNKIGLSAQEGEESDVDERRKELLRMRDLRRDAM